MGGIDYLARRIHDDLARRAEHEGRLATEQARRDAAANGAAAWPVDLTGTRRLGSNQQALLDTLTVSGELTVTGRLRMLDGVLAISAGGAVSVEVGGQIRLHTEG